MKKLPQIKIANAGESIELNPSDIWACTCGQTHRLDAYACAHWDVQLYHTCECGISRTLQHGRLSTPKTRKTVKKN